MNDILASVLLFIAIICIPPLFAMVTKLIVIRGNDQAKLTLFINTLKQFDIDPDIPSLREEDIRLLKSRVDSFFRQPFKSRFHQWLDTKGYIVCAACFSIELYLAVFSGSIYSEDHHIALGVAMFGTLLLTHKRLLYQLSIAKCNNLMNLLREVDDIDPLYKLAKKASKKQTHRRVLYCDILYQSMNNNIKSQNV